MDSVYFTATIPSGESLSNAVRLGERKHVGLIMPSAWTAADVTFQVSADGATFVNLYDKTGTEASTKADASQGIQLGDFDLAPWEYLKLRSGTAAVPVVQAAARIIQVVVK